MVKDLREKTGVGMMDCKAALAATNGDMEAAVDWLRAKGLATAQKKSSRTAAEPLPWPAAPPWPSKARVYDVGGVMSAAAAGWWGATGEAIAVLQKNPDAGADQTTRAYERMLAEANRMDALIRDLLLLAELGETKTDTKIMSEISLIIATFLKVVAKRQ